MVGFEKLRLIIERELWRHKPKLIELTMPEERFLVSPDAEAVINELTIRGVDEVELVKVDAGLTDNDFIFVLRVEVR